MALLQVFQDAVVAEDENTNRHQPPQDIDFKITESPPAIAAVRIVRQALSLVTVSCLLEKYQVWC